MAFVTREPVGIGKRGWIAFAKEATRGTAITDAAMFRLWNATVDTGFTSVPGRIQHPRLQGSLNPVRDSRGRQINTGMMTTYVTDQDVGHWLNLVLGGEDAAPGQPASTAVDDVVGLHMWSYSHQQAQPDWKGSYWTARESKGMSGEERYSGVRASNFGIQGETTDEGSQINFTCDFLPYTGPTATATGDYAAYTDPEGEELIFETSKLTVTPYMADGTTLDTTNAQVSGTNFYLKSFDLKMEYNLINEGSGGSRFIDPQIRMNSPEITFTMNTYKDLAWLWELREFTWYSLTLELFSDNLVIAGKSTTRRGIRIDFPSCALSSDTNIERELELGKMDISFTNFTSATAPAWNGVAASTDPELYRIFAVDGNETEFMK